MNPFVLVHGSNGGGWVWKTLVPLLRAAGHEVYTPTLTGLSDRSHLLHCGVDLSTHITDVANHCTANPATTPDVFGPFAAKARDRGWEVHEIAAGHLAMLTAPRELAALLLEIGAPGDSEGFRALQGQ